MTDYIRPPSTLPPGSIVDSYRRDSGGPKQDKSTDQQLFIIDEFCRQYKLIHRHKFVDVAQSGGSIENREDFERMLMLYRNPAQRPHGLLIWSLARFMRDIEKAIYYKALIRTNNIIIHSLIDNVPEGEYGRVVEFIIDVSNEEKRKQASKESKRGLRELVEKYKCVPGTPPRGFLRTAVNLGNRKDGEKHIAHRWDPNPKFFGRIRKAFKLCAAGASLGTIHKSTRLYSSVNSYKTFFVNKLYIGILEYADLVVEHYCDPIIDMDTWNTVQKLIQERSHKNFNDRNHPRRTNSLYLFSGFARCTNCGSPLNGDTVIRPTGRDEAYRCSGSKRRRDCTARRIPRAKFEEAVISTFVQYILIPESLAAHQEIAMRNQDAGETVRTQRKTDLHSEKAEYARQLVNLSRAIAEAGHSDVLLDALKQKESLLAQVRTEIEQLDVPIQRVPQLSQNEIASASKRIIQLLSQSPPDTRRQILRGLIHQITAYRTGHEVKGTVEYFYPFDLAPMSPTQPVPMGALLYRQLFTHPFELQLKTRSK